MGLFTRFIRQSTPPDGDPLMAARERALTQMATNNTNREEERAQDDPLFTLSGMLEQSTSGWCELPKGPRLLLLF